MKKYLSLVIVWTVLTLSANAGFPGAAMSFNGTNQYLSATVPSLPYAYSICAWVYLRSGGTDSSYLGVLTGTNCGSSVELLIHGTNSSATSLQYLELGRCGSFSGELSTNTIPLNQWVHIAVTVSYVDKDVTYYINGKPSRTWSGASDNMYLGPNIHLADNVMRHFNGLLDEVQIWDKELSRGEIWTNMYYPPNAQSSHLVAYWPMVTDGGSLVTPDASGSGRTGRPINMPTMAVPNYPWPLGAGVQGANPYTNECHAGFADPGAFVSNTPVSVDAGANFAVALKKDGTVAAWGNNDYGQLNVPSSATNVVAVSAGYYFALALKADGTVIGWGQNDNGQASAPAAATNVVAIAAGGFHSLVLRADGTVLVWGDNTFGQTDMPSSATNVVAIAGGLRHSLALRADGTVIFWGAKYSYFSDVPSSATNVVAITAGEEHNLALRADGTLVTWGTYTGCSGTTPASATNVVAIACGSYYNLALKADGTVVGWEASTGNETSVPASATNVAAIAGGGYYRNLALKVDGTVLAWGDSDDVSDSAYQLYNFAFTTNGVVNTNAVGTYTRTYTAKNTINTSTVTRTVEVVDTTAPVITLLGRNPTILAVGTPYVEPGATAADACGGDFTSGIVITGEVNSEVAGAYSRVYTVADSYHNTGSTQRAVWMADVPSIGNLSNVFVLAHTVPGTHGAKFYADVTAKGTEVGVWFEYGESTNYTSTGPTSSLAAGCYTSNRVLSVSNLPYGVVYHWRVVATSSLGTAVSPDQVAEWAAGAPAINLLSSSCTTTNALTGTRGANLLATVDPNGPESTAFFQFGMNTDYTWVKTNALPAGYVDSNLTSSVSNLAFGATYHWRVVATNMLGSTVSDDQLLEVPSPYARGDFNGNGVVEQSELNDVYDGYWQDNPTTITNALGLGQTDVKLVVDNLIGWDLTAQYSDDLATWSNLSDRAVPVFEFTDSDATNHPARVYRLLAP